MKTAGSYKKSPIFYNLMKTAESNKRALFFYLMKIAGSYKKSPIFYNLIKTAGSDKKTPIFITF